LLKSLAILTAGGATAKSDLSRTAE